MNSSGDIKNSTTNLSAADDLLDMAYSYLFVSLLVMASNGTVVFVIIKTRELHLPTLWVIAHMAVWDFIMGLNLLIFQVPSAFLNRFAYSDRLLGLSSCLNTLIVGQNALNTAMMVLDRYIAVKWPMKYTMIATKRNYAIATFVTILLNTCRLLVVILPDLDFYYNPVVAISVSDSVTVAGTLAQGAAIVITLGFIIVCSCMIGIEILRGRRQVHHSASTGVSQPSMTKFPLMVTISAGIFCLCHIPLAVSLSWNFFTSKGNISTGLFKFGGITLTSNSIWNVFIYPGTYRPFRQAILFTFCRSYYRRKMKEEAQLEVRDI